MLKFSRNTARKKKSYGLNLHIWKETAETSILQRKKN